MDLTITLTRYKEPNWLFHESLLALSRQENITASILVLDQFYNQETKEYIETLSNNYLSFEYIVIEARSLSYARNQAISFCKTDILLYLDSDALPEKNWAFEMFTVFKKNKNIAIIGGKIVPKWHKKPLFLIKSDAIRDLYSLLDLWDQTFPNKKVVGANFGIHIWLLEKEAYFNENLWRSEWILLWWEETDLCKRAIAKNLIIMYVGSAIVVHQILPERINVRWITKRLYWGWYGKYISWGTPGTSNKSKSLISKILLPIIAIPYAFWYTVSLIKHHSK